MEEDPSAASVVDANIDTTRGAPTNNASDFQQMTEQNLTQIMGRMEQLLTKMDSKLSRMEGRVEQLGSRMDSMEARLSSKMQNISRYQTMLIKNKNWMNPEPYPEPLVTADQLIARGMDEE